MNRKRAVVLGLVLTAAGCVRLRTAPETPPPAPAEVRPAPTPPPAADGPLDLEKSVTLALAHVPALRAARAQSDAAAAGIDLADTAYLPRIDLLWQELRSTRNNISGTMLPQGVIPVISGPVGKSRSWDSGWGSNAGALVAYEPVDFGLRAANAEVARLAARQAQADVRVLRLDVSTGAAEAFLAHLAATQTLRAAQANLERWDVFARAVRALTDRELRPGAEASRADAEVAAARTQLYLAEQTVRTSRATLAESMGMDDLPGPVDPGPLLGTPPGEAPSGDPAGHPLLDRQRLAVESAQARREALDHAWVPRLSLLASFSGRGSGFDPGGTLDPQDGLYPTRPNWAAGISLTFGVMDTFQIRARQQAEEGSERAEQARTDQLYLGLRMQNVRLRAVVETARKIAENTPVQLKAAQDATERARARYDSGLGTLTEVAEAHRLLAQAEIDDVLARLAVWRSLVAGARAQGDLDPFLRIFASARAGKK